MTKQFLKKTCIGLLLAIGLVFVLSRHSSAAGITAADTEMQAVCDTWAQNIQDYSDQSHCWACEIFLLLFDSSNAISGQINNALSKPAMNLVIMGGCLWLAFYTLIFFGNISDAPNAMEYLTKVGTIMLRVGFAGCLLAGGSSLAFNYFINPVLAGGAQLANSTLNMTGVISVRLPNDVTTSSGSSFGKIAEWRQGNTGRVESKFMGAAPGGSLFKATGGGGVSGPMGDGVRSALKQMIAQMSSGMAQAQAIAQGLRCGSFFWKKIEFPFFIPLPSFLIPNPAMWFVGAWLGCVFWIVSILFSFAMLDVIFRIGLLVSMLPVFIAAWVFPMTGSFAKTAWDMFLNSVLVFFITAIVAVFVVILMERAWDAGAEASFNTFLSKMQANSYVEAWDSLFDEGVGSGIITLFIVTAVSWWAWFMAPKSDATAKKILGASFSSSIAIKAIHTLIGFILDMIMLILTIVTFGAAACTYALKFARFFTKSLERLKKIQKAMDKVKQTRKKVRQVQQKAEKIKNKVQRGVDTFVPRDGE